MAQCCAELNGLAMEGGKEDRAGPEVALGLPHDDLVNIVLTNQANVFRHQKYSIINIRHNYRLNR